MGIQNFTILGAKKVQYNNKQIPILQFCNVTLIYNSLFFLTFVTATNCHYVTLAILLGPHWLQHVGHFIITADMAIIMVMLIVGLCGIMLYGLDNVTE